ncbi:UDP-N-acetylenolpyruvoylglucosamine reductase [Candidatus Uhrbacteria bacterium CG_4_9_14_3_um_filter_36_7]|uniref:UDP-N-acetylenolpyruvoylglucosamine reductase n=1 Tax=Candidatus Uhrbacteria bacterium CG_4_9_14_3_um_filter_36_7 TaxID=1975033 RepID=A0A2M7XEN2_9BACT|nr:MAG: UDP-N-acetylenolpyruvoylglucosamine reductase [Candidatus Uhrbacteria bacterium CG_4_9_14_3_um_filter_36_7]
MFNVSSILQQTFGNQYKENEPLSNYTHFHIGGLTKWFVEVKTTDELKKILDIANEYAIPFFVLGGGSNILVSDNGFNGLVIKIASRGYKIEGTFVQADAGVLTSFLARQTVNQGLAGLEWAITIPGTIGGAVRGNAGCFGGEMKDVVKSVQVYRQGSILRLFTQDLEFKYRSSSIKNSHDIILSVEYECVFTPDREALIASLDTFIAKRKASQPVSVGSAGCMFKNYEVQKQEDLDRLAKEIEIPLSMREKKQIPAGWLIDQLGLKGKRIGDAQISDIHGNFLINQGKATASDMIQLIALIKMRARDRFGIQLQEEVQYVGFDNDR